MQIQLPRDRLAEFKTVAGRVPPPRCGQRAVLVQAEEGRAFLTAGGDGVAARMASPCRGGAGSFAVRLDEVARASKAQGVLSSARDATLDREAERLSRLGFGGAKAFVPIDWPAFRVHLANAMKAAASAKARYALQLLCLHAQGAVGTDGRQLYAGNSARLPIPAGEQALVEPPKALMGRAFKGFAQAEAGWDGEALLLRFGDAWAARLASQPGPFPAWRSVLPPKSGAKARLRLGEEAARLLAERLPRAKAGAPDETEPLLLELGGAGRVRLSGTGGGIALKGAKAEGEAVSARFASGFLLSALEMGFRSFRLHGTERPVVAESGGSAYLWMPLAEERPSAPRPAPPETTARRRTPMPAKKPAPSAAAPDAQDFDALLAEMTEIREGIQTLSRRAAAACAALRSHKTGLRRRERAVKQTLAGLKRLQET